MNTYLIARVDAHEGTGDTPWFVIVPIDTSYIITLLRYQEIVNKSPDMKMGVFVDSRAIYLGDHQIFQADEKTHSLFENVLESEWLVVDSSEYQINDDIIISWGGVINTDAESILFHEIHRNPITQYQAIVPGILGYKVKSTEIQIRALVEELLAIDPEYNDLLMRIENDLQYQIC